MNWANLLTTKNILILIVIIIIVGLIIWEYRKYKRQQNLQPAENAKNQDSPTYPPGYNPKTIERPPVENDDKENDKDDTNNDYDDENEIDNKQHNKKGIKDKNEKEDSKNNEDGENNEDGKNNEDGENNEDDENNEEDDGNEDDENNKKKPKNGNDINDFPHIDGKDLVALLKKIKQVDIDKYKKFIIDSNPKIKELAQELKTASEWYELDKSMDLIVPIGWDISDPKSAEKYYTQKINMDEYIRRCVPSISTEYNARGHKHPFGTKKD